MKRLFLVFLLAFPLGAAETGPRVVPDRLLRRWDPVTVFFASDLGPANGGPEDRAGRFVTIEPAQAGAFRWLDGKTLQFRPAEPWPALSRFRVTPLGGKTGTLATLLEAPVASVPNDGAEGLEPFDEITLTFGEPLPPAVLAKMVTLELRALPGVSGGRRLPPEEIRIKALERAGRGDTASYALALAHPVPAGTRAVLTLRLSADEAAAGAAKELSFATGEPFRVLSFGCRERQVPVTPSGTLYGKDQALKCGAESPAILVEFSSAPRAISPVEARNLVRFTPSVDDLKLETSARTLEIRGAFRRDTLYAVSILPAKLADQRGRPLEAAGRSEAFVVFPQRASYVKWSAGQGVVERLGAQMVPVDGRGAERLDLRIQKVDPLDRSLWPFPDRAIATDESERPPGPGEEPAAWNAPDQNIAPDGIAQHLRLLGSPPVSAIVPLPLKRDGNAAAFGLDLAPHLAKISGAGEPGTYLVGLRPLEGGNLRSWMRIQATDLALATLEEPQAVRFTVTSLSTGLPVPGATVRLEGTHRMPGKSVWESLVEGTTGPDGAFRWDAPGRPNIHESRTTRRIVVTKGKDVLVLDAARPPERYADNQWSKSRENWLDWAFQPLEARGPQAETLCHLFSERPVYRPDEEVHLKGYLRERVKGTLHPLPAEDGTIVVEGPGDLAWRLPVSVSEGGSFYHLFKEKNLPTGVYNAHFEDKHKRSFGHVSFRMEAYRIPEFEVDLHGPDQAALDREFQVSLTASYYAGGKVSSRPVQWRVTQFPYDWTPPQREGFRFSSDGRFSRAERFRSSPRLTKDDTTNETGGATLKLNPAIEPTAQPRIYVVEATVTGADDQTVTSTRRVSALPAFVLGLDVPRFVEHARTLSPRILAVGPDGKEIEGKTITVRLLKRQWHSVLRASDFSDGIARYLTDVVDEKVSEQTVKSQLGPLTVPLPIASSGVYVVELEARDRLGRAQVVSIDLYAGGDEPVTWARPATKVFSVATDKAKYEPGAKAAIVLQSPFQKARALAIVEAPEGNRYEWIDVEKGAGTYRLDILPTFAPRVPVHFVLMRGRIPGAGPSAGNATDLGKPSTLAATAWLEVEPTANRVSVALKHPDVAMPGKTVDVTITLKDPQGRPLAGEVTLWLIDQAVLALGKEQRLDPLPDFITPVRSHLLVRDTRNSVFGFLPFAEAPGGDEGGAGGILDRATVRRNFKTVPFYDPAILVGADGTKTVQVQLPDNLTNFKVRAKAMSGPDRFGFGIGTIAVRLPVIVQPALPRFLRAGDVFTGAAVARIVEGKGGPASAQVKVLGASLEGPATRALAMEPNRPERIEFTVKVPPNASGPITFRAGVERASDKASDAFEVKLPVHPDRDPVLRRVLADLAPGATFTVPEIKEPVRPGTLRRSLLVSSEAAVIRMASGLDFFDEYPYGCTEQKMSAARALAAARKLRALLGRTGDEERATRAFGAAQKAIADAVDPGGLVAFWPGSPGYVSLTAWSADFLVEAKEAGFAIDDKLLERLLTSLEKALRSDYARFVGSESFLERTWALSALAHAGRFDAAYAAELARKPQFLRLEGKAEVLLAFSRSKEAKSETALAMGNALWDGIVWRSREGKTVYGGLQDGDRLGDLVLLCSEPRALAEVLRALHRIVPQDQRLGALVNGLVTMGRGDGWGSTNANASALLALSDVLGSGKPEAFSCTVREGDQARPLAPAAGSAVAKLASTIPAETPLAVTGASRPLVLAAETRYVPAEDGSRAPSVSNGFVVTRELFRIVDGAPPERTALGESGIAVPLAIGAVVEDHVQIVNPQERHHVAVTAPLAAGLEPLNPALATAPPEAAPSKPPTLAPTYVKFLDDAVTYFYDTLPAGTYDFRFRTRAATPGSFVQPPAKCELMYDAAVRGNSNGARIEVSRPR
jgi:uncharacterized protein YfaS (alpha-2-macroglobulin family)